MCLLLALSRIRRSLKLQPTRNEHDWVARSGANQDNPSITLQPGSPHGAVRITSI